MASILTALAKRAPRFRHLQADILARREFETRSREEIRAFQLERFNGLWIFALKTVPYYRRLARELDLPERFASLDEMTGRVPILEKESVQADTRLFLSEKPEPGFWRLTGGSTGLPLRCYWGYRAHRESLRDRYAVLDSWGLDIWEKSAFFGVRRQDIDRTWKSRGRRLRRFFKDRLRNRIRMNVSRVDDDLLRRYGERLRRAKVKFLYAYPTVAYLMAEAFAGRPPIETLKLVVAFAEPLLDAHRKTIETAFGAPVASDYSTIETGFIAGEHGDRRMRIAERGVILETAPAADGQNEIILTNLRNPSFPLIRYRIRDALASPPETGPAGCAVIEAVEGRANDVLRTRSGKIIHPHVIIVVVKENPFVKLFQAVQEDLDAVTIFIQSDLEEGDEKVKALARRLKTALGGELDVRIKPVRRIEATAAGKRRLVISRIPPGSAVR